MASIPSQAYTQLESVSEGGLVLPTDGLYKDSLKRWSVLAERPAGLVAFVKDEEDVSAAIKFAREGSLEIAIKGGGHNPSGASSTIGGLVIDLSKYLTNVTVDQENKIAHVQGGALWSDVDEATCHLGLATVAGTAASTGVGGLTLGGGYGYLTGRYGLAIDNLLGATVVVASGQVVQASENENQDLFFAIRGGGSNFGVVTSFQFALHPIPPVCWSGVLLFALDQLDDLIKAAVEWTANVMTVDVILMGTMRMDLRYVIVLGCVHLGPEESAKKQFKPVYDIGPIREISGAKSYIEVNRQEVLPAGKAYFSAGATLLHPTMKVFKDIMSIQSDLKAQIPTTGSFVGLEIYPTAKIMDVPNGAMAFASRGHKVNVGDVRKKVKEIISATQAGQAKVETTYGNYDADQVTGDEKVRKLFGANYRKLQSIKAKYDPDLVFGKWFPIQPLA